jgi:hypothetical protein
MASRFTPWPDWLRRRVSSPQPKRLTVGYDRTPPASVEARWSLRSRTPRRPLYSASLFALILLSLASCGSVGRSAVVVRVGNEPITKATVDRWTDIVRRGGVFAGVRGVPRRGTPRQRAVALLISSAWLIGEARRLGLPLSEEAVDEVAAERISAGGAGIAGKKLSAVGQTVAGIKLEARAELALEVLREGLARRVGQITKPEMAAYYHRNLNLFRTPARRLIDIIENIPSRAGAAALVARVGTGRRFTRMAFHKMIMLTPGLLNGAAAKKKVDYAIFAARPGVVSRPMRLFTGWTVFVVRRVFPRQPRALASVQALVTTGLRQRREQAIFGSYSADYVDRWMSKTTCRGGYVAPGCPQYGGSLGEYENPFIRIPR